MANDSRTAISIAALALLSAGAAMWPGCGGGGGRPSTGTFTGNVTSVSGETAKASSHWKIYAWLRPFVVADAIAQSSCPARHVIACIDDTSSDGSRINTTCSRVDSGSCTFSTEVALARSNDDVEIFFHDDVDGDGQDNNDGGADANIVDPIHPVCNGDVVRISNVRVDFTSRQAFADSFHKDRDSCGSGSVSQPGPPPTPTSALPIP